MSPFFPQLLTPKRTHTQRLHTRHKYSLHLKYPVVFIHDSNSLLKNSFHFLHPSTLNLFFFFSALHHVQNIAPSVYSSHGNDDNHYGRKFSCRFAFFAGLAGVELSGSTLQNARLPFSFTLLALLTGMEDRGDKASSVVDEETVLLRGNTVTKRCMTLIVI